MAKVAFLGLGVMGGPMAGHLATKGHDVTVWNRTGARAQAWLTQTQGTCCGDGSRGGARRGVRDGLRRQRRRPARGLSGA